MKKIAGKIFQTGIESSQKLLLQNRQKNQALKLKQLYMSFEESSDDLNVFVLELQKRNILVDYRVQDLERKDLEDFFTRFLQMAKRLAEKFRDLQDENVYLLKVKQQNQMLKSEIQHQLIVNQELSDIKQLLQESQQRYRNTFQENNVSREKISMLQSFSMELANDQNIKINRYQTSLQTQKKENQLLKQCNQTLNQQLSERNQQINFLKKELGEIKSRNFDLSRQFKALQIQKQNLQQELEKSRMENNELAVQHQDLSYNLIKKLQNYSAKSFSIRGQSQAILQRSLQDGQDDHEVLKHMEFQIYENENEVKPQNNVTVLKKSSNSIEKSVAIKVSVQKKIPRRNTIQVNQQSVKRMLETNQQKSGPKLPIKSNYNQSSSSRNKKLIPKTDNKKLKIFSGQRRSSGNSPISSSSSRLQITGKQQIKSKILAQKNEVQKLKKQISQYINQIKQLQASVVEVRRTAILQRYDEISQLEGQLEMCQQNQRNLIKQLDQCQQQLNQYKKKQFQLSHSLKYIQSQKSNEKMEYIGLKNVYQTQIAQYEDLCQKFRTQLNAAHQQITLKTELCFRLKDQIKQLKLKMKQYEEIIKGSIVPQIQNFVQRIFQQEREEVLSYESPQRNYLSRPTSLHNSIRIKALNSDRVMISKDYIENQKNKEFLSGTRIDNEQLMLGLQQIERQRCEEQKISPKDFSEINSKISIEIEQRQEFPIRRYTEQSNEDDDEDQVWSSQIDFNFKNIPNFHEVQSPQGRNFENDQSFFRGLDLNQRSKKLNLISEVINISELFNESSKKKKSLKLQIKTVDELVFSKQISMEINKKEAQISTIQLSTNQIQRQVFQIQVGIQTDNQKITAEDSSQTQQFISQVFDYEIQTETATFFDYMTQTAVRESNQVQSEPICYQNSQIQLFTINESDTQTIHHQIVNIQTQTDSRDQKQIQTLIRDMIEIEIQTVQIVKQQKEIDPIKIQMNDQGLQTFSIQQAGFQTEQIFVNNEEVQIYQLRDENTQTMSISISFSDSLTIMFTDENTQTLVFPFEQNESQTEKLYRNIVINSKIMELIIAPLKVMTHESDTQTSLSQLSTQIQTEVFKIENFSIDVQTENQNNKQNDKIDQQNKQTKMQTYYTQKDEETQKQQVRNQIETNSKMIQYSKQDLQKEYIIKSTHHVEIQTDTKVQSTMQTDEAVEIDGMMQTDLKESKQVQSEVIEIKDSEIQLLMMNESDTQTIHHEIIDIETQTALRDQKQIQTFAPTAMEIEIQTFQIEKFSKQIETIKFQMNDLGFQTSQISQTGFQTDQILVNNEEVQLYQRRDENTQTMRYSIQFSESQTIQFIDQNTQTNICPSLQSEAQTEKLNRNIINSKIIELVTQPLKVMIQEIDTQTQFSQLSAQIQTEVFKIQNFSMDVQTDEDKVQIANGYTQTQSKILGIYQFSMEIIHNPQDQHQNNKENYQIVNKFEQLQKKYFQIQTDSTQKDGIDRMTQTNRKESKQIQSEVIQAKDFQIQSFLRNENDTQTLTTQVQDIFSQTILNGQKEIQTKLSIIESKKFEIEVQTVQSVKQQKQTQTILFQKDIGFQIEEKNLIESQAELFVYENASQQIYQQGSLNQVSLDDKMQFNTKDRSNMTQDITKSINIQKEDIEIQNIKISSPIPETNDDNYQKNRGSRDKIYEDEQYLNINSIFLKDRQKQMLSRYFFNKFDKKQEFESSDSSITQLYEPKVKHRSKQTMLPSQKKLLIKNFQSCFNHMTLSPSQKPMNSRNMESKGASTQISPQQSRTQNNQKARNIYKITQQQQDKKDLINRSPQYKMMAEQQGNKNKLGDNINDIKQLARVLSGQKLKFIEERLNIKISQFNMYYKWETSKVYIIDAQRPQEGRVKLLLWRKGLIEVKTQRYILSGELRKRVPDQRIFILGNNEISIKDNKIRTRKNTQKAYYAGNLWGHQWRIYNISIYSS